MDTGVPYEVDHIVPILNDNVCGFHCIENLRLVTEVKNRAKGNKLVDDIVRSHAKA